jgi:hypothetical protein
MPAVSANIRVASACREEEARIGVDGSEAVV